MYRQYLDNPESVSESWRDFSVIIKPAPFNREVAQVTEKKGVLVQRNGGLSRDWKCSWSSYVVCAARIVENRRVSLSVPTATSTRIIPVKLLEENRNHTESSFCREQRG